MSNKIIKTLIGAAIMSLATVAFGDSPVESQETEKANQTINLVPKPVKYESGEGEFKLEDGLKIYAKGDSDAKTEEIKKIGEYFADILNKSTGYGVEIVTEKPENSKAIILVAEKSDPVLGNEGYKLIVTQKGISLKANDPEGLFRGVQTLRQLLPPDIEKKEVVKDTEWVVPACTVYDYPRFPWRGMMLDVSRHFHPVDNVKRLIDLLVIYKINVFHLHLTDDQGWRIEIKKYPKLTDIGGSRQVGGGKGGFYTQQDYIDIINYAKDRYMTVVPEVDMPGHCNAALASYPELNPDNKTKKFRFDTAVGYSTFMCRNEFTYTFIKDVIDEICAITPGKYFHVGGDESKSTTPEDYKYFINRIEELVKANNKIMIGWQENIASVTAPDSGVIAQYWVGDSPVNRQVIASPGCKAYLDMKYNKDCPYGLTWAGQIPTDVAYNWDPDTFTKGATCIGVEAPLWSETISKMIDIEYLTFPRILGYAEIGWTPKNDRNWDEYKLRLAEQGKRLRDLDVNFYEDSVVPWDEKIRETY